MSGLDRRTKVPMLATTVRLPRAELDALYLAAGRLGVSQSDFLRAAVREKAAKVIREDVAPR